MSTTSYNQAIEDAAQIAETWIAAAGVDGEIWIARRIADDIRALRQPASEDEQDKRQRPLQPCVEGNWLRTELDEAKKEIEKWPQGLRASFNSLIASDGNEEARWIEDTKNACTCCGGSGHKDDMKPDPRDAVIRELRGALRFYADENNHSLRSNAVESDNGYIARAALSKEKMASASSVATYNQALGDAKEAIQRLIESTRQPPEHSFHVMAAAIEKRTVLASAIAVIDELRKPEKDAAE